MGTALRNKALRVKLEKAHRILHMQGLAEDSTRGHITVRSDDGLVYIKPWGSAFEKVKAEEMQGIDMDGNLQDGKGKLHSEIPLHLEILRARSDVKSVIHIHPYHSIILSSVFTGSISPVGQHAAAFTGEIPFYQDPSLIRTKEQGLEVVKVLGVKPVVLLKNHGIIVAGRSLEEAVILAIEFEKAAKDHLYANLFGKPNGMLPEHSQKLYSQVYRPDQIEMIFDYYAEKAGMN